jgi:hypothetical protein
VTVRKGWFRVAMAGAVVVAAGAAPAAFGEALGRFLRWVDFLSAAPGLSGLAVLVLSFVAVVGAMFAVRWVVAGFSGEPRGNTSATETGA